MIAMRDVVKSFDATTAVAGISLTVNQGEIFGLVGPDGAGKTTTIRMMTGIVDRDGGEITLLGANDPEQVKDHIGYVPQKFSLYGDLTVIENIQLMGSLYGVGRRDIDDYAAQLLSFTNLLPFKNRLADHLSGGMKQKLALAAGLMHRPKLLFLDEPTTGVDPVSRREFWQMLYNLNKDGMTVVVSTPYMDEADLCSRIAFMHNGKIVACGTPRDLKQHYPHHVLELMVKHQNMKKLLTGCPVREINAFGDKYHLIVDDPAAARAAVEMVLHEAGVEIIRIAVIPPTLEDVFVALAGEVA